jgi:hypothetical protein
VSRLLLGLLLLGAILARGRKRAGGRAKDRDQRKSEGGRAKKRNAHSLLRLVPKAAGIGRLTAKTCALIGAVIIQGFRNGMFGIPA